MILFLGPNLSDAESLQSRRDFVLQKAFGEIQQFRKRNCNYEAASRARLDQTDYRYLERKIDRPLFLIIQQNFLSCVD